MPCIMRHQHSRYPPQFSQSVASYMQAQLGTGAISYSIVVPALHPQSRWVNISGQQNLVPGMPEHALLQAMLDGPLPVKLMVRATHLVLGRG